MLKQYRKKVIKPNILNLIKNESVAHLSRRSGVNLATLRNYLYNGGPSTFILLKNVSHTLGCDIEDLFNVKENNETECNIRKLAKERKIKIAQVAKKSRVTDVCIYKWLSTGTMSYLNLYKLSKALNCKIENLFTITGEE